jgi:hypothetical protein
MGRELKELFAGFRLMLALQLQRKQNFTHNDAFKREIRIVQRPSFSPSATELIVRCPVFQPLI